MSINIGPAATDDLRPRITVVGIGGAGGNAITNMIESEIEGVDFIVANTDAQALASSPAETRIQLGPDITGGLGAGARPEVGKAAAEEPVSQIEEALEGVPGGAALGVVVVSGEALLGGVAGEAEVVAVSEESTGVGIMAVGAANALVIHLALNE